MTGVLDGITVLDLTSGIGGPMATMLLADHGARVTKLEPPGGDPGRHSGWACSGAQVWHRSKRSAELDLHDAADRARLHALVTGADVLVHCHEAEDAPALGLDFDTLHELNPRLIVCAITAYGGVAAHAGRPARDALVAARTGQHYEARGTAGGTLARLGGVEPFLPELEVPEGCETGAHRDGPLVAGVPWLSAATGYQALIAISAALLVRERTGRGQHVGTSMLQGALTTTMGGWQRAERPDTDNWQSWVVDSRAPKAVFRCADGRWVHQWTPLPSFVLSVSEGDELAVTQDTTGVKDAPLRIGVDAAEILLLHHYVPLMAERFAKFPAAPWVALAAAQGVPLQPIRSPEEALLDPLCLADGCVIEVDDPQLGPVRQVGRVYELHACPTDPPTAPVAPGTHNDEVYAEADRLAATLAASPPVVDRSDAAAPPSTKSAPLEGVKVLDLGLAVAGPWGTMMLADLGADVIKVNTLYDDYWMATHIAMGCNRGKRSISLNLKDPAAMAVLHRLVEEADVVQHNMRYEAAVRLGVDYESLRTVNPRIVYCHTRGFERGPREGLPGNDQTGAALAGPDWLDGGLDHAVDGEGGGVPYWPVVSLGDTGNGFLSTIAMLQALYHRDRTGEGQFVDTSIVYAHLLNASMSWVTADGSRAGNRPSLDAMQLGFGAAHRMYETADGWLVVGALDDAERAALALVVGCGTVDDATPFDALEPFFRTRTAAEWFAALDAAGVPCEVSDGDYVLGVFDDPELQERGWVTSQQHPVLGRLDTLGLLFDFSETPGVVQRGPFMVGQHTREIMGELGYSDAEITQLAEAGVLKIYDSL
jgi:crotonobetainyl-CoA:carnitine CoA-transferase CaiB-like acyl-CoA transferase